MMFELNYVTFLVLYIIISFLLIRLVLLPISKFLKLSLFYQMQFLLYFVVIQIFIVLFYYETNNYNSVIRQNFYFLLFGIFVILPIIRLIEFLIFNVNFYLIKYRSDVTKEDLSLIGVENEKEFTKSLISLFFDIREAVSFFDFNKINNSCTPSRYELYKKTLNDLNKRNCVCFFEKPKIFSSCVLEINSNDVYTSAVVLLSMSYIEYIIDGSNCVISGSKNMRKRTLCQLIVRKYKRNDNMERCLNCGNELNNSYVCQKCNSVFDFHIGKWILDDVMILK